MNEREVQLHLLVGRRDSGRFAIVCLLFVVLITGCTSYLVGGEIVKGRKELLYGDPKDALTYFEHVASLAPNYVTNFTLFGESVWTYVGRANYASGNLEGARKALERALSGHGGDDLARVYLGLVLLRQGEEQRGRFEIETGLIGLADWLDFIEFNHPRGYFWDPAKKIRSESRRIVTLIRGKESNWRELFVNVEWIAREIELEIDRVWQDEQRDRGRNHNNNSSRQQERKIIG